MAKIDLSISNLDALFPPQFSQEQIAKGKTLFLKELALKAHRFYGGKSMTIPKAGVYGFNWFNVWYTPGVSKVSTTIRDDNNEWVQLESYLSARLDISFTHSICPACIKKHYPDLSE